MLICLLRVTVLGGVGVTFLGPCFLTRPAAFLPTLKHGGEVLVKIHPDEDDADDMSKEIPKWAHS